MLGIAELLDRKPKALSGGQRQRVAVGRAIVRKPKVFLFDEPLSNLDAKMRATTRAEIARLHDRLNATMVYVTHDQVEAMTLADRVVVMDRGRIVQVGSPMDIYERPLTRFVAGFIGAPRMNFIPARVGPVEGGGWELAIGEISRTRIPSAHAERFARFAGKPVEVGIRPEHIVEGTTTGDVLKLDIIPALVEPTGADTMVFFSLNGIDVSTRCRPDRRIGVGKPMCLSVDFDSIYLIDPETGSVVPPNSAPGHTASDHL
jgi:multiple sugar transport system ATP-binding protein